MRSPEDVARDEAKAVAIATEVLERRMSPILGARHLRGLLWEMGVPDDDADVLCLTGVVSETDRFPVGPEQREWARDALDRLAAETRRSERWALDFGEKTFRNIVQRWSTP